jgi:hypothetical protein
VVQLGHAVERPPQLGGPPIRSATLPRHEEKILGAGLDR